MTQIRTDLSCPKCASPCYIQQDSNGLFMACVYAGHTVREDPYDYPTLPKEVPKDKSYPDCAEPNCIGKGAHLFEGKLYCSTHYNRYHQRAKRAKEREKARRWGAL